MRVSARVLWARLGLPGKVALAIVGVALAVLVASAPGLLTALMTSQPQAPREIDSAATAHAGRLETHVAQIDGRSLFFVPAPPSPPSDGAGGPRDEGPREAPRPTRYGGPGLIALINDQAWFADGLVLTVGGKASDGLQVVRADPPWSATVLWSGVEFEVPLLERDAVVMKAEQPASRAEPVPPVSPEGPPPEQDRIAEENGTAEDHPDEPKEQP